MEQDTITTNLNDLYFSDIIKIEKNGITHELSSNNKISDLLKILINTDIKTNIHSEEEKEVKIEKKSKSSNPNSIEKYVIEINLKEGIKIKTAPREDFLSGKTQLEELIHPFFQKEKENNNKNFKKFAENTKKENLDLKKCEKILLFTPHPDDEILGASGLLYNAFKENLDLKVVYMTSGKNGGNADERKNEAISGIEKLGGTPKNLIFSDLPFYSRKDRLVTDEDYFYVSNIIEEQKPKSIFICADIFDPNGTHRKCFDVLIKIYKSGEYKGIKFYFYYSVWYWPKENEYSHILNYEFETYRLKVYAMLEHKSQMVNGFMGEDPRPFYQRACARDAFYGAKYGSAYSEVFYLLE